MKGTKLWQATGSPIIQGRSRLKRPFLNVWAFAFVMAAGVLVVSVTGVSAIPGNAGLPLAESLVVAFGLLLPAIPGLLFGSAAGVGVARLLGTRRVRTAGALAGVVLGIVSMLLLASELTLRGVTIT